MTTLRAAVEQVGLTDHWTELESAAMPAFAAHVAGDEPPSPSGSRLGGRPALPPPFDWPTADGETLTFVAQLNLSEFPAARIGLPASGLLSFFVGVDEPATNVTHAVRYFPDPDGLRECASPLPDVFPACTLSLRPTVSLPEALLWKLGDPGVNLGELLDPTLLGLTGRSRVGGHPHHGTDRDAYLCASGRESLLYTWHEPVPPGETDTDLHWFASARSSHDAQIRHWHNLLSVDSHEAADMLWWDAGQLDFLIDDRDLSAARFDRTYACVTTS
jgi:hypothetical protein